MPARSALPPLLVAAGLVAGLVTAVFEPILYRFETTLVIERNGDPVAGNSRLAHTFADLAASDVVLRNVSRELGAPVVRGRLHVHAADGVVHVAYDAGSRVQAARVAQQVAIDFSRAVTSRFPASGERATVFDPPHDSGRPSPHILRDAAVGLLAGLVAAAFVRLRPPAVGRGLRERGRWRVSALSRLVERGAAAHPDQIEDWRAYVGVLRGQA